MKNLAVRITSALIAFLTFLIVLYFFGDRGLYWIIFILVLRGSYEVARMSFNDSYPAFVRKLLVFLSAAIYLIITQEILRSLTGLLLILSFVIVVTLAIVLHKKFQRLEQVLTFIAKTCFGLIYTCFLPATVIWLFDTNNGLEWLFCMICVVFSGDIGAYAFGNLFGKNKLAPSLSPNKSVEGAIGGLALSVFAACCFIFVFPNTPIYILILAGLLGGFLGQVGDLFESLIKRISGVKDAGAIMPGHGGVLDRVDGVLLAAPLFYLFSIYYSL